MTTTALSIITGAARLIGVTFKSEALSADEAADGLTALNDMLASWTNNGLLVNARTWETFSVSAASSYTIGPSQTLNTVRPISIKAAFFRNSGSDYDMDPLTDEEYERIVYKSSSSDFPDYFNYDNGHPTGIFRFFPQLSAASELHLLTEKPLTAFAALTTSVDLPPGWNKALKYNLAIDLAPEYGQSIPQEVAKGATDSMSSIMLAIAKNRPIKFSPKNTYYRSNIYADLPNGYY